MRRFVETGSIVTFRDALVGKATMTSVIGSVSWLQVRQDSALSSCLSSLGGEGIKKGLDGNSY